MPWSENWSGDWCARVITGQTLVPDAGQVFVR
jgi:hypothetical protein